MLVPVPSLHNCNPFLSYFIPREQAETTHSIDNYFYTLHAVFCVISGSNGPMRNWKEIVEKDCQAHKLNKEDAIDGSRWRKLIKDVWWSGWMWVGECFFWYRPTQVVPDKGSLNGSVCVCVFRVWWTRIVCSALWSTQRPWRWVSCMVSLMPCLTNGLMVSLPSRIEDMLFHRWLCMW